MKKTILILVALALLVPAAAFGATEFSLGGFIKLDTYWDSSQNTKNNGGAVQRNNDQLFHHGVFNVVGQGSRFNLTIKGPKLWSATTTAFIEMDFDSQTDALTTPSHSFVPRLRHAMFRLNWPETELLFGQYWAFTNEYNPETIQDAGLNGHGTSTHRLGQIRLTQKFAGAWTIAGMIARPTDPNPAEFQAQQQNPNAINLAAPVGNTLGEEGISSETPHIEGKLQYEQDLWGKAPFYGRPRGFTAQVTGGWQRTRYRSGTNAAAQYFTFGQNQFQALAAGTMSQHNQQYLDPWIIQGDLFIPVLPTHSNNLAGSASLSAQWFVGQGLQAFGYARQNEQSFLEFKGIRNVGGAANIAYDRELVWSHGGYVQGQYYFSNQWFMNVVWGFQRYFGYNGSTSGILAGVNNVQGYKYATAFDQLKIWQEIDVALYYRPIEAFKFGIQYGYTRSDWLQKVANPNPGTGATPSSVNQSAGSPSSGASDVGESHRVIFTAIMYF